VSTLTEAADQVRRAQRSGRRVVFTNGVFDLLHVGHLRYLQEARELGDMLVVGLNSDASTRTIKGDKRPLVQESERAELLLGLRCVDLVVPFDEPTAERLVDALRPDVYVKGGDYSVDQLPEARIVERYGGEVKVLLQVEGRSTTDLVDTIRQRFCP